MQHNSGDCVKAQQSEAYCMEKLAPAGSNYYYSLLHLPTSVKTRILPLLTFEFEIQQCLSHCSDLQIAQTKLEFWSREIYQWLIQTPSGDVMPAHPLTRALFFNKPHNCRSMLDVIEANQAFLLVHQFTQFKQWQQYSLDSAGKIANLLVNLDLHSAGEEAIIAADIHSSTQLGSLIQLPARIDKAPHTLVPSEDIAKFNLSPGDIDNDVASNLLPLREHYWQNVSQHIHRSLLAVDELNEIGFSLLALMIHAQIVLTALRTDKNHFLKYGKLRPLLPLRKYWIGYRLIKRFAKNIR